MKILTECDLIRVKRIERARARRRSTNPHVWERHKGDLADLVRSTIQSMDDLEFEMGLRDSILKEWFK